MNLLLLRDEDFLPDGTARITGRRRVHALEVLKAAPGDRLKVGRLGGRVGEAEILARDATWLSLKVELISAPPPRPGVDLLLAIPRPKALKKILPAVASLGVDRVVLVNAARVEKSYFDSKVLAPALIEELLIQGLEQARDTQLPTVLLRPLFRPFVEDELDQIFGTSARRLVAHPTPSSPVPSLEAQRVVLAIGPEGGWVPFELELLVKQGFQAATLGPRVLRVEVAVPLALGVIQAQRAQAGNSSFF